MLAPFYLSLLPPPLILHFSSSPPTSFLSGFLSLNLRLAESQRERGRGRSKMLLGKRPRPPMKRTTSTTEITFDLGVNGCQVATPLSDPQSPFLSYHGMAQKQSLDGSDRRLSTMVSPRNQRRHSCDFQFETAQFLKACSLCQRHLVPGRDIYMYRGDSAFCSLECRQHQMNQDETKEKCSLASKKEAASSSSVSAAAQVPSNGETVAAV